MWRKTLFISIIYLLLGLMPHPLHSQSGDDIIAVKQPDTSDSSALEFFSGDDESSAKLQRETTSAGEVTSTASDGMSDDEDIYMINSNSSLISKTIQSFTNISSSTKNINRRISETTADSFSEMPSTATSNDNEELILNSGYITTTNSANHALTSATYDSNTEASGTTSTVSEEIHQYSDYNLGSGDWVTSSETPLLTSGAMEVVSIKHQAVHTAETDMLPKKTTIHPTTDSEGTVVSNKADTTIYSAGDDYTTPDIDMETIESMQQRTAPNKQQSPPSESPTVTMVEPITTEETSESIVRQETITYTEPEVLTLSYQSLDTVNGNFTATTDYNESSKAITTDPTETNYSPNADMDIDLTGVTPSVTGGTEESSGFHTSPFVIYSHMPGASSSDGAGNIEQVSTVEIESPELTTQHQLPRSGQTEDRVISPTSNYLATDGSGGGYLLTFRPTDKVTETSYVLLSAGSTDSSDSYMYSMELASAGEKESFSRKTTNYPSSVQEIRGHTTDDSLKRVELTYKSVINDKEVMSTETNEPGEGSDVITTDLPKAESTLSSVAASLTQKSSQPDPTAEKTQAGHTRQTSITENESMATTTVAEEEDTDKYQGRITPDNLLIDISQTAVVTQDLSIDSLLTAEMDKQLVDNAYTGTTDPAEADEEMMTQSVKSTLSRTSEGEIDVARSAAETSIEDNKGRTTPAADSTRLNEKILLPSSTLQRMYTQTMDLEVSTTNTMEENETTGLDAETFSHAMDKKPVLFTSTTSASDSEEGSSVDSTFTLEDSTVTIVTDAGYSEESASSEVTVVVPSSVLIDKERYNQSPPTTDPGNIQQSTMTAVMNRLTNTDNNLPQTTDSNSAMKQVDEVKVTFKEYKMSKTARKELYSSSTASESWHSSTAEDLYSSWTTAEPQEEMYEPTVTDNEPRTSSSDSELPVSASMANPNGILFTVSSDAHIGGSSKAEYTTKKMDQYISRTSQKGFSLTERMDKQFTTSEMSESTEPDELSTESIMESTHSTTLEGERVSTKISTEVEDEDNKVGATPAADSTRLKLLPSSTSQSMYTQTMDLEMSTTNTMEENETTGLDAETVSQAMDKEPVLVSITTRSSSSEESSPEVTSDGLITTASRTLDDMITKADIATYSSAADTSTPDNEMIYKNSYTERVSGNIWTSSIDTQLSTATSSTDENELVSTETSITTTETIEMSANYPVTKESSSSSIKGHSPSVSRVVELSSQSISTTYDVATAEDTTVSYITYIIDRIITSLYVSTEPTTSASKSITPSIVQQDMSRQSITREETTTSSEILSMRAGSSTSDKMDDADITTGDLTVTETSSTEPAQILVNESYSRGPKAETTKASEPSTTEQDYLVVNERGQTTNLFIFMDDSESSSSHSQEVTTYDPTSEAPESVVRVDVKMHTGEPIYDILGITTTTDEISKETFTSSDTTDVRSERKYTTEDDSLTTRTTPEAVLIDSSTITNNTKVETRKPIEFNMTTTKPETSAVKPPSMDELLAQAEAYWHFSNWFRCTAPCGEGKQFRLVFCAKQIEGSSIPHNVDSNLCPAGHRPRSQRTCNKGACPTWNTSQWSKCSSICGPGMSYRKVVCRRDDGKKMPERLCGKKNKPDQKMVCHNKPCNGAEWITSSWSECSGDCYVAVQARHVTCADSEGQTIPAELCSPDRKPESTRACQMSCDGGKPEWFASQWSECSVPCGEGLSTRFVTCMDPVTNKIVNDSYCGQLPDYFTEQQRLCNMHDECRIPRWFAAPWNPCRWSITANSLVKRRVIFCLSSDGSPSNSCDPDLEPDSVETCQKQLHTDFETLKKHCSKSRYGCCPDNIMPALGPNHDGCLLHDAIMTCMSSRYGCCLDNRTPARGPYFSGCPNTITCNDTYYGCCQDGVFPAGGPNFELCADTGDCFLSEFGCCLDGVTAAQGVKLKGCRAAATNERSDDTTSDVHCNSVTGSGCQTQSISCNDSQYGCCADGVTTAEDDEKSNCHSACEMRMDSGNCEDSIPHYYYNADSRLCEMFFYSGCGGNSNRFPTADECQRSCLSGELVNAKDAVTVEIGSEVQLTCVIPSENHTISWRFVPLNQTETNQPRDITDLDYDIDSKGDKSYLIVTDIQEFDSGNYICETRLESTSEKSSTSVLLMAQPGSGTQKERKDDIRDLSLTTVTLPYFTTIFYQTDADRKSLNFETSTTFSLSCVSSEFGCCPDGITASQGLDDQGCPEDEFALDTYPQNLAVASVGKLEGSVEVNVSWSPPNPEVKVDLYTLFSTNDETLPLTSWMSMDIKERFVVTQVREDMISYFKIRAMNSKSRSPVSPSISFSHASDGEAVSVIEISSASTPIMAETTSTQGSSAPMPAETTEIVTPPSSENISDISKLPDSGNTTTYTPSEQANSSTTVTSMISMSMKPTLPTPENFKITRSAVASDRVAIHLTWENPRNTSENPVTAFLIRFVSGTRNRPIDEWRKFSVADTKYFLALKKGDVYYFRISSLNSEGDESKLSPVYFYSPEEQESKLDCKGEDCNNSCESSEFGCCPDGRSSALGPDSAGCPFTVGGCSSTRWGCCSDGMDAAVGPGYLGCIADPQPCDISEFGCCPDGRTEATGEDFARCSSDIDMSSIIQADCRNTQYGCCEDGVTPAKGDNSEGCTDLRAIADICKMPSDTGSCSNYSVTWYYDISSGTCRRFWYGGCEGNANRFSSRDHCESVCVRPPGLAACYLPRVIGRQSNMETRWYFDQSTQTCQQFEYGGSAGNSNNFVSEMDCQQFCKPSAADTDICSQPKVSGACRGSFTRWWYNRRSGACEEFVYSGCQGNENRFATPDDCHMQCGEERDQIDKCSLQKNTGNCLALIPSWYYDDAQSQCVQFYYSGCGGNLNRFKTEAECKSECSHRATISQREICSSPADAGNCYASMERWAYDATLRSCQQFTYGGCAGNRNRFMSEEECMKSCNTLFTLPPDPNSVCMLPTVSGSCAESITRYSYDYQEGTCKPFLYSGCAGNDNNFQTQRACELSCAPHYEDATGKATCSLPEDKGTCQASLLRWRYEPSIGTCVEFLYGGCQGNRNNFLTAADCLNRCQTEKTLPEDICLLRYDQGLCGDSTQVYHYDSQMGKCVQTTWTGCGGNSNRFATEADCMMKCSAKSVSRGTLTADICSLPEDSGPCRAAFPRWFYNPSMARCDQFVYGGCRGNANNFLSREQCEEKCHLRRDNTDNVCNEPMRPGSCLAYLPRWYYNAVDMVCQQFIYGGCDGNHNRFATERQCLERCGKSSKEDSFQVETSSCSLEVDAGVVCAGGDRAWRWFYDRREGSCQQFVYNGCYGNANRYETKAECEQSCSTRSQCTLPEEYGMCMDQIAMYRYDIQSSRCIRFTYSGCGGNTNRFETRAMCEVACKRFMTSQQEAGKEGSVCYEPLAKGGCSEERLSYYFDGTLGVCKEFVYTGCGGNGNRFDSIAECRSECMKDEPVYKATTESNCPKVTCYNQCPEGYAADINGCQSCKCADPCQGLACGPGTQCRVTKRQRCKEFDLECMPTEVACVSVGGYTESGGEGCKSSRYGCCLDGRTAATDPQLKGCPEVAPFITRPEGLGSQFVRNVGDSLSLPCNALGSPRPKVTWYKSRSPITDTKKDRYSLGEDNSLNIENIQAEDGGEYVCRAFNEVGDPAYEHLTLTVHEGVLIKDGQVDYYTQRGDSVELTCDISGHPKPEVFWVFEGEIIKNSTKHLIGENNSLIVSNVEAHDMGDYVCVGRNQVNTASKTLELHIREPLKITLSQHETDYKAGDKIFLNCEADGFPPAKVEWMRNDESLPYESRILINGHSLEISNASEADSGYYTCVANNEYEAGSATTSIKVTAKMEAEDTCRDLPKLANCDLIVRFNYCGHPVYKMYCCKSCAESRHGRN